MPGALASLRRTPTTHPRPRASQLQPLADFARASGATSPGSLASAIHQRHLAIVAGEGTEQSETGGGSAGLVKKAGKDVKILPARNRLEMGILSPDRPNSLKGLMDVFHAAILLYERQGIGAVQRLLEEVGRDAYDAGVMSILGAIGTIGEDGSAELVTEARIANALLEALGHTSAGVWRTGEQITHRIE